LLHLADYGQSAVLSKELVSVLFFSVPALVIVILSSAGSSTTILAADNDEEDFEEDSLIKICCTWGKDLADGILTYSIVGDVDAEKKEAVHNAIHDWDDNIESIKFEEVSSAKENENRPDIQIRFVDDGEQFKDEGPETAGNTKTRLDKFGFMDYNTIIIAEGGLGKTFEIKTIETIAKHEIGHALGLGHANFGSNLMTTKIESAAQAISSCELEAVRQANSWKLMNENEHDSSPSFPEKTTVTCKS
jgi:Matrixin